MKQGLKVSCVCLLALIACGKDKGGSDKAVDDDETPEVTSTIDPDAKTDQVVEAGPGTLESASVTFPPGSVTVATEVKLEEGVSIANATVATELGLGTTTLTAASTALIVTSSVPADAAQPFTVALPLTTEGANLIGTENLVVLYRIQKADGQLLVGLIPPSSRDVEDGVVTFTTKHFGVFQAAEPSAPVTSAVEVLTGTPIISKDATSPLVGSWGSPCAAAGDEGSNSLKVVTTYGENDYESFVTWFTDPECADVDFYSRYSGTYVIGGPVVGVDGAQEADLTNKRTIVTPGSKDAASSSNAASRCGFTDWQAGVPRDVSGLDCDDARVDSKVGRVFYDIFKIDGDKLYGGINWDSPGELDGSSEEKRPKSLWTAPAGTYTRL